MTVRLPIGLKTGSEILKDLALNELDGYSREIIADKVYRNNPSKMTTKLLIHCVSKEHKLVEEDFRRMFVTDRNSLIMHIQMLSVGNEVPAQYICNWCDSGFEIIEDLGELDFKESEEYFETIDVVLDKGYTDKDGNTHKEITLGIPTGADEEITSSILRRNYGEWVNTILARKTIKFGLLDMNRFAGIGVKIMRSLSTRDLDKMVETITEKLPGFDLKHDVVCPSCGKANHCALNMTNFF